jgi:hypothetical protein
MDEEGAVDVDGAFGTFLGGGEVVEHAVEVGLGDHGGGLPRGEKSGRGRGVSGGRLGFVPGARARPYPCGKTAGRHGMAAPWRIRP